MAVRMQINVHSHAAAGAATAWSEQSVMAGVTCCTACVCQTSFTTKLVNCGTHAAQQYHQGTLQTKCHQCLSPWWPILQFTEVGWR
jgi:pyruvate/oxaloacetate carboxyltransferase